MSVAVKLISSVVGVALVTVAALAQAPMIPNTPPVNIAINAQSPYDFYDTFSGAANGAIIGRIPDMVSNGNAWQATGSNVANYKAGAGILQMASGAGQAYAVMHTQCAGAPAEIGGTFISAGPGFSPTIASVLNYGTYAFGDMVHPNLSIPGGGGAVGAPTTALWSTNPPNSGAFTAQAASYAPSGTTGTVSTGVAYNYRVFPHGNYFDVRVEVASTGQVVTEAEAGDPLIASVDGPDAFWEIGDNTTQWTAAWARCVATAATQTGAKFVGGLSGTPIGADVVDMAPGNFTSGSFGDVLGLPRYGALTVYNNSQTTTGAYFLGGTSVNGVFTIGAITSGYASEIDLFNGASFPTRGTTGEAIIKMDGSYVMSFTNNGTTWLQRSNSSDPTFNQNLVVTGALKTGGFAATASAGEIGVAKITASGTAPGAAGGKLALVCGTNAGSAKLIAYAGTSTTPVTILDNIGSGVTGC